MSAVPHDDDPLAAIGAALDNPAPAPALAEQGERVDDGDDDGDDDYRWPLDAPIVPLGASSGLDGSQRCYYLNTNGEIVSLEAGNKHGKNNLVHLFGAKAKFLESEWPQWSKPGKEQINGKWVETTPARIVGFDQAKASRAMIMECSRRGIFDPAGRLRGRGAHRLTGGGLVIHYGDQLGVLQPKVNGELKPLSFAPAPLLRDGFVYPAGVPLPRPWPKSVPPTAAITVQKLLETWNWKRPSLDPVLLLGAIGQGYIGGALPWRSNVWITGGRGTGKSTLNGRPDEGQGIIAQLYGEALFRTGNTSAAAIRQSLKNSTVPVMIDEAEASGDNRKITEVVELARVASSGDKMHRGGQDHSAHEFTLQSPFWFSSINMPPLEGSDRSRLAILELRPFKPGTAMPDFGKYNFADLGKQLHRRMIDAWPILAECKSAYHRALAAAGHDGRACDQFGTLLACAWMLLNDELPDEETVHFWAGLCAPQRLAEVSDAISDEEACVNRLMTELVQPRGRDSREAVSELLGRWVQEKVAASAGTLSDAFSSERNKELYLEQLGLKVVNAKFKGDGRWGAESYMPKAAPGFLAIANAHRQLDEIFDGSRWQKGTWRQTMARLDHAIPTTTKFAGHPIRCVLVPLYHLMDESELPDLCRREAVAQWMAEQTGEAGA
ncbi:MULTISPECIES: hypothetical protein [unclassified Novosphingobium]|uniref:hypothetical protein n=1 Tax=unclassified Novosphingobium TaxID=2644732 RepID=UPI000D31B581|nr:MULTISPECIES: hypothetical protein [unclassified Novosphingobium]PTR07882.1 hypothetical protein C8K11_11393 [Novosphingobium sp. GV055]PUB00695.1 hypothetical protein C8K12_11393 [Novosphingobium sp. GV061]PUB16104.1 hypothetical protein C8K14_11393 [Novosphingobium sp. GV079]PUB39569.1 hypothetical protein C8K10_11393 [Novosphingobium sp. GV027]